METFYHSGSQEHPNQYFGLAGLHEHTFLLKFALTLIKRFRTNPTPDINPVALRYLTGAGKGKRVITMAQEREDHKVGLKIFHNQEDVTTGLRKVIIASVSKDLIVELEDEDTFFDKVEQRDLIATVMGSTTSDTTFKSMKLVKLCNTPLAFDTNKKLNLKIN